MWMIVVGIVGGVVLLVLHGLHDEAQILRDWEMVLSPWGADAYRELEERVDGESRMAEYAYRRAFVARAAGSTEEAVRLLEVGLRVVERTSPDMMTLLRGMSVVSRMAAAISPLPALRPGDFRLWHISGLAMLGAFGHRLLVSTGERLRLRAYVLRRGFGVVTRFLLRTTERIRTRSRDRENEWERIAAARADLRTLSAESLHTFHALLRSLAAEQR